MGSSGYSKGRPRLPSTSFCLNRMPPRRSCLGSSWFTDVLATSPLMCMSAHVTAFFNSGRNHRRFCQQQQRPDRSWLALTGKRRCMSHHRRSDAMFLEVLLSFLNAIRPSSHGPCFVQGETATKSTPGCKSDCQQKQSLGTPDPNSIV